MRQEQCIDLLEPLSQRYKPDYTPEEREMIYNRFFWMTPEMFKKLRNLVLAKEYYRIPAVDEFTKMQMAHPDAFRRIKKTHEECDTCGGVGMRMFLQRRWDKKHLVPAARCT
ncbi:hypothetical protein LCGC14_1884920, partial [marine sediment metagenome]